MRQDASESFETLFSHRANDPPRLAAALGNNKEEEEDGTGNERKNSRNEVTPQNTKARDKEAIRLVFYDY